LIDLDRIKGKLQWPLQGKKSSLFSGRKEYKIRHYVINNGIKYNLANGPVRAIYPGEVVFADYYKGYGNLIILQHAKNLYTLRAIVKKLFKQKGDMWMKGSHFSGRGFRVHLRESTLF